LSRLFLRLFALGWLLSIIVLVAGALDWLARHRPAGKGRPKPPRRRPIDRGSCRTVPRHVYRRPDPMIYSQKYLMDQGLAVTWDNPDIQLFLKGAPVSSSDLKPKTTYDVVATIWNGSFDAPAVNLPVRYSYLDFGMGAVSVPIGETKVDLPANGAPGCPAFAHMSWLTPSTPGHYCLQVELIWPDDANPLNNLGQENTDVVALNSPHGSVAFPVRNASRRRREVTLEVDAYAIPPREPCEDRPADAPTMTDDEKAAHRRSALARHRLSDFPVPEGWRVVVEPREMALEPGESQDVTVDIIVADGFAGRQALNVRGLADGSIIGGVTLYVEGSA
jgi:hypothetical protein